MILLSRLSLLLALPILMTACREDAEKAKKDEARIKNEVERRVAKERAAFQEQEVFKELGRRRRTLRIIAYTLLTASAVWLLWFRHRPEKIPPFGTPATNRAAHYRRMIDIPPATTPPENHETPPRP